jgi:hypothetical protein
MDKRMAEGEVFIPQIVLVFPVTIWRIYMGSAQHSVRINPNQHPTLG